MDALQKNIAVMRGEAMAATLLASLAIRNSLAAIANPEEVLAAMAAYIDDSLNMSGPAKGDPDDAFNTQVRETARLRAMNVLDDITRGQEGTAERR